MTLFPFPGGLCLDRRKSPAADLPIESCPLPPRLILPLRQRDGSVARQVAPLGERVLRGQVIAGGSGFGDPPIHAPTSGRLTRLPDWPLPLPGGARGACLAIEADGEDAAAPALPPLDPACPSPAALRERLHQAGIVGLGGAGFPAAGKLDDDPRIDTVIVNGAECEPYLACDDALLRERADEVARGAALLRRVLGAARALIAIEADMTRALAAARAAVAREGSPGVSVVAVPVRYPAGGERQLIQTLTGRETPSGDWPGTIGVLCQNVATVAAIHRAAANGEALVARLVTVAGAGVRAPRNLEVRLGTPLGHLIARCGGYTEAAARLMVGGPMMGFPVSGDDVPVTKTVNAVLVAGAEELPSPAEPLPCIRCGACADVCPVRLLPQDLHARIAAGQLARALELHLSDCIECGCCDAVCPSRIPLTADFQRARQATRAMREERERADHARRRHEARQARLLREQRERESAARQRKAELGEGRSKIQAALDKARRKRAGGTPPPAAPDLTDGGSG